MSSDLSDELRSRASAARRIAGEVRDPADAEALRKMADELDEQANSIDAGAAQGGHDVAESSSWIARARRRGVELPVFIYTSDDQRVPSLMTDLSYDGCQLRAQGKFENGEPLTIVHAQIGEIRGKVQWVKESSIGVRFDGRPN